MLISRYLGTDVDVTALAVAVNSLFRHILNNIITYMFKIHMMSIFGDTHMWIFISCTLILIAIHITHMMQSLTHMMMYNIRHILNNILH